MAQDDFAIVVALTRYPRISELRGPENDALEFLKWLRDPTGGNIIEAPSAGGKRVFQVLSSEGRFPEDDEPSMEDIEAEFQSLYEAVDAYVVDNPRPRRLYIFIAGHGLSWKVDNAALLAANAGYGFFDRGKHIAGRWFADWFRDAALFQEVVLLMDCCRDEYLDTEERHPWPSKNSEWKPNVKFFYGFATLSGSQARERQFPEDDNRWRGLFTMALLDGLKNAKRDSNGSLMGATLGDYVETKVVELAGEAKQRPLIMMWPHQGIKWVEDDLAAKIRIVITPPRAETVELSDPHLKPIGSYPADQPIELPDLDAGLYSLRWPDGHEQYFKILENAQSVEIRRD